MHAIAWMRKWRGAQPADEHAGAVIHAAARGDSLDQVLDLGVQTLLEAACADRAGLWLSGERRGGQGGGRVVEVAQGPIPEQWKRLDITMPFLRATLESPEPLQVEVGSEGIHPSPGSAGGYEQRHLDSAALPKSHGRFGHGGARAPPRQTQISTRCGCTRRKSRSPSRIHRDARRRELAAEELRAQLRLSRAILCGVSADSILPQIARAARHYVQAEFVALGGSGGSPVSAEGWDGPEEWRSWMHQEALMKLWRKVFDEGREFEITGEDIPAQVGLGSGSSRPVLDRVIAIPIEVQSRTAGVLMAGFLPSQDGDEDMARLESYALLAASALDREVAREERAACKKVTGGRSSRIARNVW